MKNIIITILAMLLFASCSESEFKGSVSKKKKSTLDKNSESSTDPSGSIDKGGNTNEETLADGKIKATLKLSAETKKTKSNGVDMVWIIDNSGSMRLEANHVRNNLVNFANSLGTSASNKLMLISKKGNHGTAVTLPIQNNFMQIHRKVSSRNALTIINHFYSGLDADSQQFRSFFRKDVPKVFVFVTDDDELLVSPANFLANSKQFFGQTTKLSMFGFVALQTRALSPCMARFGSHYNQLAQATGSKIYNICETNWDKHFADLKVEIEKITPAENQFKLEKDNIVKVEKVVLDGVELDSTKYSLASNTLTLNKSLLSEAKKYEIEVTVIYNK